MTILLSITMALAVANVALTTFILWRLRQPAVDVQQIGAAIANRLLDIYQGETDVLTERYVHKYAREQYVNICAATGLPLGLAEKVMAAAWDTASVYVGELEPELYE